MGDRWPVNVSLDFTEPVRMTSDHLRLRTEQRKWCREYRMRPTVTRGLDPDSAVIEFAKANHSLLFQLRWL